MKDRARAMIEELYLWHSTPIGIAEGDVAIAFGRADGRVAETLKQVMDNNPSMQAVVTGGQGKDSGTLPVHGITEAAFIASVLHYLGGDLSRVVCDHTAVDGVQNVSNSLDIITARAWPLHALVVVAHATQLRRLRNMLRYELNRREIDIPVNAIPTSYPFNPEIFEDQLEVLAETSKLALGEATGNDMRAGSGLLVESDLSKGGIFYEHGQWAVRTYVRFVSADPADLDYDSEAFLP